jgi:CRISPR-associated endoribonuclease Cas6
MEDKEVENQFVYSSILELYPENESTVHNPLHRQIHALVLNLIRLFNPSLSERLHDEPGYRPFTVSLSSDSASSMKQDKFQYYRPCYVRITLFDDVSLWQQLCTYFFESGPIYVHLGNSQFRINRLFSASGEDPTGLACTTSWQTLYSLPSKESLTMHFVSPTAFSWGCRRFILFPEPFLLWESLLHTWNRYSPLAYRVEREEFRMFLLKNIQVTKCSLRTNTLYFPNYTQKGFVGSCSYSFKAPDDDAALLTTLAAFAYYAGVGYKTTMGMGQVRLTFGN